MCKAKQVVLLLCVLGIPVVVYALGTENFGDRPIEISCDWYDGVAEVALLPGLVYARWVNGGDVFCYKADINEFNKVLQKFSNVSSPFRRLVIESGSGTIKSFQGDKEFNFDWKLEVTSGIELSMIISEFTERKDRIYPSLTLFLDGDDINVERLNIPAGIDVIISDSVRKNPVLSAKVQKLAFWENVQDKWHLFIQPELEKIRNDLNDITINCVEIRSPEISKYLPRHRIFAIETMKYPLSNLFAVSVDGEIKDISKPKIDLSKDNKRLSYPSISSFVRNQEIKIVDANAAISMVKLIEDIFNSSKNITRLKLDTIYYTVFDSRVYPRSREGNYLKYTAEKQNAEWIIKKQLIKSQSCLAYERRYVISVDQNDLFKDLWEIH